MVKNQACPIIYPELKESEQVDSYRPTGIGAKGNANSFV